MTVDGEPGEDGRRNGEERGELKDLRGEAMFTRVRAFLAFVCNFVVLSKLL
jgi:hypothetical protein